MDPHSESAEVVRLFADLLESNGEIKAALWDSRAETGAAVGKCGCGLMLAGRPAESPSFSNVTYRDVFCPSGHEASIVGTYKGATIGVPPGTIDVTTSRKQKEDQQ